MTKSAAGADSSVLRSAQPWQPPTVINAAAVDALRLEQAVKAVITATTLVTGDLFKRPLASIEAVSAAVETHDVDRLKALLRANDWPVQHESRRGLWRLLAYGAVPQSDGVFKEYAAKLFAAVETSPNGGGETTRNTSPLAIVTIAEEFRANYFLSTDGTRSVQRVLRVLGETNPHIREFTFLLYAFTSALLHYLPEEDCFDSVYALLRRSKTDYFLAPSELSLQASAHVLRDLAFRYAKSAATSLERQWCIEGNLSAFCADWLLWIFKYLPFNYLVRIIDCYLVEGFKVLYRVALALMMLYHKSCGKRTDFFDVAKSDTGIKRFCEEIYKMVSIDKLLKTAFNIRGFTRNEITRFFAKNELQLRQSTANGGGSVAAHLGGSAIGAAPSAASQAAAARSAAGGKALRSIEKGGRAAQRSFKFDHAIHSHVDLIALGSAILDKQLLAKVWSWLPEMQAVRDPVLVFTTNDHGYSIKRFYEHCDGRGPTLLLIKTVSGEVFGAYCSADWYERQRSIGVGAQISYFGTGESFVFALVPEQRCHYWVGRVASAAAFADGCAPLDGRHQPVTVDMFMAADGTMLTVGGGGGEALQVDESLNYGHSSRCATFENLPLCSGSGGQFQVQTLEAIAFR